ncbi:MAG: Hsp20/alpha crystallin family protein [Deltaproteobacteria bacterium]|nr:Hsp20/alpha crystallin family protein [Deltaproteobacteria bacterium]
MENKEMTVQSGGNIEKVEKTRNGKHYFVPPVDILEYDDGLTLVADMPGAEKESISIGIENDILVIEGHGGVAASGENIHREFEPREYHRRFQLNEGIDREKASAEFHNGVLTLKLPKAEAAKPKQIKIETRH